MGNKTRSKKLKHVEPDLADSIPIPCTSKRRETLFVSHEKRASRPKLLALPAYDRSALWLIAPKTAEGLELDRLLSDHPLGEWIAADL